MDPVFVLFWVMVATLGGFLVAYVTRNQDFRNSLVVLASFVAIGLSAGSLMGNPWAPSLVATAFTIGLSWACLDWYLCAVAATWAITMQLLGSVHTGNHEWHSNSSFAWRGTWLQRLARWWSPFPIPHHRVGRGMIELSTRYARFRGDPIHGTNYTSTGSETLLE